MAQPRIRDALSFLTTLPASITIAVCLFLPHTKTCGQQVETPFESGMWPAIVPLILVGLMPVVWRITPPRQREGAPELWLAFTLLALALFVITIPIAIWLMWGYSKKRFRGELLCALCSVVLVTLWLFCFPLLLLMFDTWLPAAKLTWAAGLVELAGVLLWTSAAGARPPNAVDAPSLHAPRSPLSFVLSV